MSNKDELEKFIIKNRSDFDQAKPDPKIWDKLDRQLDKKKGRRLSLPQIARVAAAGLLILAVGIVIGLYIKAEPTETIASSSDQTEEEFSLGDISEEYEEMEIYYQSEINKRMKRLARFDYDKTVEEDIEQLDDFFNELKSELINVPKGSEEQIIGAMINNYKTRVDLLERVLEHMESAGTVEKKDINI